MIWLEVKNLAIFIGSNEKAIGGLNKRIEVLTMPEPNEKIKLVEEKTICTHWGAEAEKWYFSIVDVCAVLAESVDPAAYWRKLKQRLVAEGNETVTNCHGLKMKAAGTSISRWRQARGKPTSTPRQFSSGISGMASQNSSSSCRCPFFNKMLLVYRALIIFSLYQRTTFCHDGLVLSPNFYLLQVLAQGLHSAV